MDNTLERTPSEQFERETATLIKQAEDHRLKFMNAFRGRELMAANIGIFAVLIFGSGFGYFLYIKADVMKAIASIVLAFVIPLAIQFWTRGPIKAYITDYKTTFMPHMARALGGFKFHPKRGISRKILPKTGVVPAHDTYKAEDCFIGMYKGVKVILSEARLFQSKKPVFDGVFVLLEIPNNPIDGHTILTRNKKLVRQCEGARWQSLSRINMPDNHGFDMFAKNPDTAQNLVTDKILKELGEASDIFDDAPLSAVFFGGKYVFLSIPYAADMFEASNIYMPIATLDHANTCRREIEQILEIIDVFDVYRKD